MPDSIWTSVPLTDEYVHGAAHLESTSRGVMPHRLPAWALRQAGDPRLTMMQSQPSGVRLAFRSVATAVQVRAYRSRVTYGGLPARPDGMLDLTVDGRRIATAATSGGRTTVIDITSGQSTHHDEEAFTADFDGLGDTAKTLELWLPHNESIELIAVSANASVAPVTTGRRRWVHHGSSISQGSNAIHPSEIWPVLAARSADVDLVNLGFGGSALLDAFVARTIRDLPADLISVKLGINLVNADLMRMRAFRTATHGFLDTIRDGHPDTPLLIVSPIFCGIHETTPGPGAFDLDALSAGQLRFRATGTPDPEGGKLTLTSIRTELDRLVTERRADDPNIHYIDGRTLFSEEDAKAYPLPDALHPGPEAHRLIGERFLSTGFGGRAIHPPLSAHQGMRSTVDHERP